MRFNTLSPAPNSRKSSRRLGRGFTRGKTCGRGHKGYLSRSGSSVSASFEGGQMPIQRRLPKNGFAYVHKMKHHKELIAQQVLARLLKVYESDIEITVQLLKDLNFIPKYVKTVKILGVASREKNKNGMTISCHDKNVRFSAGASSSLLGNDKEKA